MSRRTGDMRALGLVAGALLGAFMMVNGLYMLLSPSAWFRLPNWLAARRRPRRPLEVLLPFVGTAAALDAEKDNRNSQCERVKKRNAWRFLEGLPLHLRHTIDSTALFALSPLQAERQSQDRSSEKTIHPKSFSNPPVLKSSQRPPSQPSYTLRALCLCVTTPFGVRLSFA